MFLPVGQSQFQQNQKLHNTLLGVGAVLIITGIALACISSQATVAIGSVCMSLGTPIFLMGLILSIIRCSNTPQTPQPMHQQPPTEAFGGAGHTLGTD